MLICEDADQPAKIARIRADAARRSSTCSRWIPSPGAVAGRPARRTARRPAATSRPSRSAPDDAATIVYTSGTTGPPKGCELTHANCVATIRDVRGSLRDELGPGVVIFMFLPLAHVLARVVQFVTLDVGATLAFWSGDPKRLLDDLAAARPTHFPSVPRVFEKVHARALAAAEDASPLRRRLFEWALATGARARAAERRGERRPRLRAAPRLADRLVLSRVRDLFGGELRLGLTGAAPIGREVLEFFDACGVLVLEGYGMTETCAAATLNTPGRLRFGTVGRPLPGSEVAIADDGEVLHARAARVRAATTATPTRRRRCSTTAGCARATSARSTRTASSHHRPQEGPHHHVERQEHHARRTRDGAARDPLVNRPS